MPAPSSTRARWLLALLGLALAAGVTAGGVGWYYASQILGPDAPDPLNEQVVRAVTDSTITLSGDVDARTPGEWAVEWRGGYGELGPILRADRTGLERRFTRVRGRVRAGLPMAVGPYAAQADPARLLGIPYRDVAFTGPAGPVRAWWVPGRDSSWMIFVHGRGAERAQSRRVLPLFTRLGWTSLVIAYRNHDGLPARGDGRYRLGATEWREAEAAVRWARDRGARRVVIVGYSMGGGIALEFLRHSTLAPLVSGVVLESPVLAWRPVFDIAARERGVPPPITALGMWVAERRGGLTFDDLDQLAHAGEFHTPMLVLHGPPDSKVPFAASAALARTRPDLVTLVALPSARHVRGWNVDPRRYETAIERWLAAIDARTAAPSSVAPTRLRP